MTKTMGVRKSGPTGSPHRFPRLRLCCHRGNVRPREKEGGGGKRDPTTRKTRGESGRDSNKRHPNFGKHRNGVRSYGTLTLIRRLRQFGQRGNVRPREKDGGGREQDPTTRGFGRSR